MNDKKRSRKNRKRTPNPLLYSSGSLEYRKLIKKQPSIICQDILLRNIPIDDWAHFKAWCNKRGYSATGKIRQMLRDCISGKVLD